MTPAQDPKQGNTGNVDMFNATRYFLELFDKTNGDFIDFPKQVITHSTQDINMQKTFLQDGLSITKRICISIYKKDFSITFHVLVTQTHLRLTQ